MLRRGGDDNLQVWWGAEERDSVWEAARKRVGVGECAFVRDGRGEKQTKAVRRRSIALESNPVDEPQPPTTSTLNSLSRARGYKQRQMEDCSRCLQLRAIQIHFKSALQPGFSFCARCSHAERNSNASHSIPFTVHVHVHLSIPSKQTPSVQVLSVSTQNWTLSFALLGFS